MGTAEKINEITRMMHTFDEQTLEKYFEMVKRESLKEDIVAYSVQGKPLMISEYQSEIQKGIDDINTGKIISDDDLAKEMETW